MIFRSITPEDYDAVREFLAQAGWQHRVDDPDRFRKMLENTNRTIMVVDGSRIVGFARALCDEVSNGYISMVAVAPDRRGQGIGRDLVRQLIKDDAGITWVLRAGRDSSRFWERLGFESSKVAMDRVRRRNPSEPAVAGDSP
jgi:ribosomal protein S18 acetylase RimI-like enzyme